ncbi:VWA domain-containing protein [Clostridiaceae bacterium 35-E11]
MRSKSRGYYKQGVLMLTLVFLWSSLVLPNSYALEIKENVKAPINLVRQSESNQVLQNEEFVIDYKIQPQSIAAKDIVPESYLKDKDIVLVMDTSGSMEEYIRYIEENPQPSQPYQSIFNEKYAPRDVTVRLRNKFTGEDIQDYTIHFKNPKEGNNLKPKYLIFYSEKDQQEIEDWMKNLTSEQLKYLYWNSENALGVTHAGTTHFNACSWFKDIDGKSFDFQKSYHFYVATLQSPNRYWQNGDYKILGLSKTATTAGQGSGGYTRKKIEVMKQVAKNFLEKFKKDDRIRVALVPYSNYANNVNFSKGDFAQLSDPSQYQDLVNKMNALTADGGTNIGDGLRKAYYKFNESSDESRKYVILMTDGEPTFYSYRNHDFYFGDGSYPKDYRYNGGGSYATKYDIFYANEVAKRLISNGTHEIDSFMIAFSNDADQNELKNIAKSANGYYKEAWDGNALDEVYQKLADQIQSDLPIHGMFYEETFPNNFEIISVSEGLEVNGQTVTGDIGSISYVLNKATNRFEAEPFELSIVLKAKNTGVYTFSNNQITYQDIDGSQGQKRFPELKITVYETDPPQVDALLHNNLRDENTYKLTLNANELVKIKVKSGSHVYYTSNHYETLQNFVVDINTSGMHQNAIEIEATDQSGNVTVEDVPVICLLPLEMEDYFHTDNIRPVKIKVETETNSTITQLIANNNILAENRLTDEGKYMHIGMLQHGNNPIEITVTNSFDNRAVFQFEREIDAQSPVLTADDAQNYAKIKVTTNEKINKIWVETDLNKDEIITDGEPDKNGNPTIREIFHLSEDIDILRIDENTFEIPMMEIWQEKDLHIKARDLAGNIGVVQWLPTFSTVTLEGFGIYVMSRNLIEDGEGNLNLANSFETQLGIQLVVNGVVQNSSIQEEVLLNLNAAHEQVKNIAPLTTSNVKLYPVIEEKLGNPQEITSLERIDANKAIYKISFTLNNSNSNQYMLVYTFHPEIDKNQLKDHQKLINRVEMNNQSKQIDIYIKPLPSIE